MQELRLVGVTDDGEHLLLTGDGERFVLALDEELRATVRRSQRVTTAGAAATRPSAPLRPRDIQGLIRGGVPLEEIAERAGWPVDKVRRYEGPIRAERDYVCERAKSVVLPSATETVTLGDRTASRLEERSVEAERVVWDSWKSDESHWTVVVRFPAGGRLRQATWLFDPQGHLLRTVDDEARWLGGDELTPAVEDVVPRAAQPAHLGAATAAPTAGSDAATRLPQGALTTGTTRVERFDVGTTPPPFPSHPRPDLDAVEAAADDEAVPATNAVIDAPEGQPRAEAAPTAGAPDETGPTARAPESEMEDVTEDAESSTEQRRQVPERPAKSRSGRPSVPSWDDIMFGGRGPKG